MEQILIVVTIILGVIITTLTLFQGKGGGLGGGLGGAGGGFQTRRGIEKVMLQATVVLVFVFLVISIINLVI